MVLQIEKTTFKITISYNLFEQIIDTENCHIVVTKIITSQDLNERIYEICSNLQISLYPTTVTNESTYKIITPYNLYERINLQNVIIFYNLYERINLQNFCIP